MDGQEVNQFGTNPKNKDTDGDTLSDGDEVNKYHTSPIKSDTDGDGVLDGVEVSLGTDPLCLPTDTPVPTPTPSPSATPSPSLTPTCTPTVTPTPTPTPTVTIAITLNQMISFETLPDGTPINTDLFLAGNEYSSRGLLLAGAPETSYCSDATLAAIRMGGVMVYPLII